MRAQTLWYGKRWFLNFRQLMVPMARIWDQIITGHLRANGRGEHKILAGPLTQWLWLIKIFSLSNALIVCAKLSLGSPHGVAIFCFANSRLPTCHSCVHTSTNLVCTEETDAFYRLPVLVLLQTVPNCNFESLSSFIKDLSNCSLSHRCRWLSRLIFLWNWAPHSFVGHKRMGGLYVLGPGFSGETIFTAPVAKLW